MTPIARALSNTPLRPAVPSNLRNQGRPVITVTSVPASPVQAGQTPAPAPAPAAATQAAHLAPPTGLLGSPPVRSQAAAVSPAGAGRPRAPVASPVAPVSAAPAPATAPALAPAPTPASILAPGPVPTPVAAPVAVATAMDVAQVFYLWLRLSNFDPFGQLCTRPTC